MSRILIAILGLQGFWHRGELPKETTSGIAPKGGNMTHASVSDSTSLQAARIAVLALRASLPDNQLRPRGLVVVSSSSSNRALTDEGAAGALAALPKPVGCSVGVGGENLTISCEPLAGNRLRTHEVLSLDLLRGLGGPLNPTSQVLLRGKDEAIVVPVRAFEMWCRDYTVPAGLLVSGRPPQESEKHSGVKLVFVFSAPEDLDPDSARKIIRQLLDPPSDIDLMQ